jgi:hypothetical protein
MSRRQELIDRLSAKPGLRGKVDAHCVSCIYEVSNGGSWRQQVQACTVTDCPLYSVRAKRSPDTQETV